jgi:hypothetical protein
VAFWAVAPCIILVVQQTPDYPGSTWFKCKLEINFEKSVVEVQTFKKKPNIHSFINPVTVILNTVTVDTTSSATVCT